VKASKVGLLILILGFGGTVETAWRVRNQLGVGPWDWRVLTGGKFSGPSYAFEVAETRPLAEVTKIEIENRFGGVKTFVGGTDEVKIVLRKVVYRSNEKDAETFAGRVRLEHEVAGGTLRIGTNRGEVESGDDGRRVGFETHLEVTLPPNLRVAVQNEHGPTEVSDVAEAVVNGSFDSVRVERVAGRAEIEARHGDVIAADVAGTLKLTSRHGDVEVRQVKGHVTLLVEHGDVSANDVGGLDVEMRHGTVSVDGVVGDLAVRGEHAGVDATAVTGGVVAETSYREVTVRRVGGDARLTTRHGEIGAEDVAGAVYAESRYEDVHLARVAGPVEVRVTHGGLEARGLEKGAIVRVAGEDVVIDGFKGGLDVQADRAGVRLVPAGPLAAAISVRTTHGGIELAVPEGSRFTLEASSTNGSVDASLAGFTTTQTGPHRVTGTMNGGGSSVVLSADGGDVQLRAAAAVTSENAERDESK
jgi:DUF4097 and DUF4098 domain-containing protein YvlB